MGNWNANYYSDGSCALEMPARYDSPRDARFRAFAGTEPKRSNEAKTMRPRRPVEAHEQSRLQSILDASEMFCSLKTEDSRGCRFNQFSYGQATFLAGASSLIAIVALILGA